MLMPSDHIISIDISSRDREASKGRERQIVIVFYFQNNWHNFNGKQENYFEIHLEMLQS